MKKTTYVLAVLIVILIVFILWISKIFQITEYKISHDLFNYQIKEVKSFIVNIERVIEKKYGDNLFEKLKTHPELRDDINLYLSSFITSKVKNLFIVYKPDNEKFFRVLADGSLKKRDRFTFNEKFEPLNITCWYKVLATKQPVFFKQKVNRSKVIFFKQPLP